MTTHIERRDRSTTGSQIAGAVIGGMAGLAVGLMLAQRFGGLKGIAARLRRTVDDVVAYDPGAEGDDGALEGEWDEDEIDDSLGERVLEAFRNDPVLAERAIDIEAAPAGTIELSGEVDADREVGYAATIAGGVPGVARVVARLGVRDAERPTRA